MATKTISLRLTPENHAALKRLAAVNGMTVHAVIHALIAEGCEEVLLEELGLLDKFIAHQSESTSY